MESYKFYFIVCDGGHEYQRILDKYKIMNYDCKYVTKGISKKYLYNRYKNLRHTKYQITYKKGIKIIPDFWLWCNEDEIERKYIIEKKKTNELFDEIRWKQYNNSLHKIVSIYYEDNLIFKYEMAKIFKLFRELKGIYDVGNVFRLIEFLLSERDKGREYNVYEAIKEYNTIITEIPKTVQKGENEFKESSNKMLNKNIEAYKKLAN